MDKMNTSNQDHQHSSTSSNTRLNNTSSTELKINQHEINDLDYSCGLLNFRPKWLQKLAKKQIFLLIFCLTSVLQGMYFTYIVSVLTTIEKLYQLNSRTTGFIISSVEIGQITGSLSLTYFGGKGDRPKWIGFGILLFAFGNMLCSSPHFLLPSELERSIITTSQSNINNNNLTASLILNKEQLFKEEFLAKEKLCLKIDNLSTKEHPSSSKCKDSNEQNKKNKITLLVTIIFTTAAILVGFGTTAVNTLGIPYIDDNVAAKESPLYFAITIGIKIFGPVLGFLLGSLCTSIYINFPLDNGHGLTPSHPQWISAWWLGVFMLGTVITFNSIFMMSFPKKLPSSRSLVYSAQSEESRIEEKTYKAKQKDDDQTDKKEYSKLHIDKLNQLNDDDKKNDLKEETNSGSSFFSTIKRLLNNKILICRISSTVFHTLPVSGLYTFLPKYLEYQYRITASDASFLSGIAGIMVMGLGIFTSGIYMRKYNPNARIVSRWICIATFLYVCGMIVLMFLGCPLPKISNLNLKESNDCLDCNCESNQFSPVCASNSISYLSPCLAGCQQLSKSNNTFNYSLCKCLPDNVRIVKDGFCDVDCNNLIWYIILFSTVALLHSTTEVGAMLLTLRSVNPNDKTVALGLVAFVSSLLGSFPCPIIYGTVIDTACIFWQKDCNTNGACRLFDSSKFRIYFHGLTAFFMFLAFLFDLCVWFMSSKISFLDGEEDELNTADSINSSTNVDKLNDTNNNENENKLNIDDLRTTTTTTTTNTSSKLDNDGNNNNNLLIEDCKLVNRADRVESSLLS